MVNMIDFTYAIKTQQYILHYTKATTLNTLHNFILYSENKYILTELRKTVFGMDCHVCKCKC